MKFIIVFILFVLSLSLQAAPVSRVPSTNRVYAVVCPNCGTTIKAKPVQCLVCGVWTPGDGSMVREYQMRFQCKCGDSFGVHHKFYTHQPQAVEVPDAINPLSVTAKRKIKSPKDK